MKLLLKLFLLHGKALLDLASNTLILNASLDFIISSKIFEGLLCRIAMCYIVKNAAKYLYILFLFRLNYFILFVVFLIIFFYFLLGTYVLKRVAILNFIFIVNCMS